MKLIGKNAKVKFISRIELVGDFFYPNLKHFLTFKVSETKIKF